MKGQKEMVLVMMDIVRFKVWIFIGIVLISMLYWICLVEDKNEKQY
jgi:hypothetical protein